MSREVVIESIPPSWQPSAWLLERKFPDEFALKRNVEHKGDVKWKSPKENPLKSS